jgi:hypothetical protein
LTESFHINQPHRCFQTLVQPVDGFYEALPQICPFRRLIGQDDRLPGGKGVLELSVGHLAASGLRTSPKGPLPVKVRSGENREQPGPGSPGFPELMVMFEGSKGSILEQVLGVGLLPTTESQRGTIECIEMLTQHFLECASRLPTT